MPTAVSANINALSEIHLPKVPYKGLELKKPPRGLHKATQGQERKKGSPAVPSACTATAMWVPVFLRSVYTHLEIPTLDAQGQPAYGAISATFLHNTWNARWRFQKTFGQGQGDIFGRLLPESRSGETSVRGVPGKPRPEPGGTGTLVLTMDPRWRLEGFSRCPAFHKPTLAWGCGGVPLPIIICGKASHPRSPVLAPFHLISEMGLPSWLLPFQSEGSLAGREHKRCFFIFEMHLRSTWKVELNQNFSSLWLKPPALRRFVSSMPRPTLQSSVTPPVAVWLCFLPHEMIVLE